MRRICAAIGVAVAVMMTGACGPRQASVRTAPAVEATLHFTNNFPQPVNVYILQNGAETLVRQVGANTTENLPVRGIPLGTQVQLRAVTVDGRSQIDSQNPLTVASTFTWKVP